MKKLKSTNALMNSLMPTKIIFLGIAIILCFFGNSQNVNIPDVNFKSYLIGNSLINTNSDSEIQVNEANSFTGTIQCSLLGISDLTGIEAFPNLTNLYCNLNDLTSIDVSQNTALIILNIDDNDLTSIDVSQNTGLTFLSVEGNNLTTLNVYQNVVLERLRFRNNNLSVIDISANIALTLLDCSFNDLGTLDVSTAPNIDWLRCDNNNLSLLNMKNVDTNILTDSYFYAVSNPNLTCIEVDDTLAAVAAWAGIDSIAKFSLNCDFLGIQSKLIPSNFFINLYPNPVNSQLNIELEGEITSYKVMDVCGRTVLSSVYNCSNTIGVSTLRKGTYILQLETSEGLVIEKFIKI